MEKTTRRRLRKVQFTVDEETVSKLEESKHINNDPSLAMTFRRAAALTAFFDRLHYREGYEVFLKKGDDEYLVVFAP